VAGPARDWAHAKHCQWVVDRRALETLKGPGVEEVLLTSPQGRLLEGLASNFFVVIARDVSCEGTAIDSAAAGDSVSGLALCTSGPGDAALAGVVQRRVVQAANALGLAVEVTAPRVEERHSWREGFLTNWWVRGWGPTSDMAPAAAGLGGAGRVQSTWGDTVHFFVA
jgi:branched-subunit amino acid aminotransferase/4-amino-4-deoxychorismate lyase